MAQFNVRETMRLGLLAGVVAVTVSMVGMVESFDQRDVITRYLTLGQLLLFTAPVVAGFLTVKQVGDRSWRALFNGTLAGLFAALPIFALLLLTLAVPTIRQQLVNVSPTLIRILTFDNTQIVGGLLMMTVMGGLGLLGAVVYVVPDRVSDPITLAVGWTLLTGLLSEVLLNVLRPLLSREVVRFLFGTKGIQWQTAVILTLTLAIVIFLWRNGGRAYYQRIPRQVLHWLALALAILIVWIPRDFSWLPPSANPLWIKIGLTLIPLILEAVAFFSTRSAAPRTSAMPVTSNQLGRARIVSRYLIVLLVLPAILGVYLTEVVDNIGLFILMGLGLNIVVGFAGLLDLGYVAFFAIGAYMTGILTSTGPLGVAGLSFWMALPLAVATSTVAGLILGIPVLRMRGDYLAIVTLGFGEIIRVLAISDLLKPYIGGAQGVLQIPKPDLFGFTILQPQHFYYIILAGVFLALFIASRLRDARLGRQWMAMREDEDVAEAMGIHLVTTKLLAFGIGAAFSGLAGAIFAARLGSIFPHSFALLISINVLSLIIVGGMGSLPGVVVGALVLVGLPELLREFAEYRLLLYGVLLIAMMVRRPEGLWPSPVRRRELHAEDDLVLQEPA